MRVRKASLFITIAVCVLLCGCGPTTTWSAEARSPNGDWLAIARSEQWSGPGNAYDASTVFLKSLKGAEPPTPVLGFSHEYATMNLNMQWVTPTHLQVTYKESARPGDHVRLNLQIARYAGIDISAQYLSSDDAEGKSK